MTSVGPRGGFSVLWCALACSIVASLAVCQTVPASLQGVEGGSSSIIPFGLSTPVRYQCIYDLDQLGFAGARPMGEIRFRPDWNGGNPIAGKQFLRIDMDVSTSTAGSDAASATFADNHGFDRTRVATFLQIALPSQADLTGGSGPRAADIVLPFQQPFWYGTSPVRGGTFPGSLVVDIKIRSQPPGVYPLDSPFTCDSQIADYGGPAAATDCLASTGQQLTIRSSNDIRAAGNVTWSVANLARNAPFRVPVWFDTSGDWLQFDASGIVTGVTGLPTLLHPDAPGCFINVRFDMFQLAGVADAMGNGGVTLALPSDREIVGIRFHAQVLAFDLAANRLGLVGSRGVQSTICGPLGCARIYNLGNADATTGSVTFGAASVIEVR